MKLLQQRECFTGFRDHNLPEGEHALDDLMLGQFLKKQKKYDSRMDDFENGFKRMENTERLVF